MKHNSLLSTRLCGKTYVLLLNMEVQSYFSLSRKVMYTSNLDL